MGFAAAAALTFCTPVTGAAAEPAAVAEAFRHAWNSEDIAALSATLSPDAWLTIYGDFPEPAPVLMSNWNQGIVLASLTRLSTKTEGTEVLARYETPRLRIISVGADGQRTVDGKPTETVIGAFRVENGCITKFVISRENGE